MNWTSSFQSFMNVGEFCILAKLLTFPYPLVRLKDKDQYKSFLKCYLEKSFFSHQGKIQEAENEFLAKQLQISNIINNKPDSQLPYEMLKNKATFQVTTVPETRSYEFTVGDLVWVTACTTLERDQVSCQKHQQKKLESSL